MNEILVAIVVVGKLGPVKKSTTGIPGVVDLLLVAHH